MAFTPDGQMQSTWHIRVGSTFKKSYKWSTGTPAVPVDLTGWTAAAQIYLNANDPEPAISLSTTDQSIVLTATGDIHIEIDFGEGGTKKLAGAKKAVFDFELTNPAQTFRRNLIGGTVVIYPERTKP